MDSLDTRLVRALNQFLLAEIWTLDDDLEDIIRPNAISKRLKYDTREQAKLSVIFDYTKSDEQGRTAGTILKGDSLGEADYSIALAHTDEEETSIFATLSFDVDEWGIMVRQIQGLTRNKEGYLGINTKKNRYLINRLQWDNVLYRILEERVAIPGGLNCIRILGSRANYWYEHTQDRCAEHSRVIKNMIDERYANLSDKELFDIVMPNLEKRVLNDPFYKLKNESDDDAIKRLTGEVFHLTPEKGFRRYDRFALDKEGSLCPETCSYVIKVVD